MHLMHKKRRRKRKRKSIGERKEECKIKVISIYEHRDFQGQKERLKWYFINLVERGISNGNEIQG